MAKGKKVSKADLLPIIDASIDEQGMANSPFGPGAPIRPFQGYGREPRAHDFLSGYNISARPRSHERVSFTTLQGLVSAYDVAQICIWHRIDSVRSLDWNLTAVDGYDGDPDEAIAWGKRVLARPDRRLPFKAWLAKYLFDVLAYDAGTLYRMRNNYGSIIGLKHVDGTTIAPLIDDWGDLPLPPAPAYVQFAQGVPFNWLTDDDLIYVPFRPSTTSPYGQAPLETILLNANTDLRFQTYFLQRFTSGNVPEGFAGAPEGWTPTQIKEYQSDWDALLYGDQSAKSQIKWVPNGTTFAWSNEKDFTDEFSLFLMRKTAAAYHVVPADLGFTEDVNRSSGETQADVQFRVGDLPLIQHVEAILSNYLADDLHLPLRFNFDTGQETQDRLMTAQANKIYIEAGVLGISEVREAEFGLAEADGMPIPRFLMTSRSGPVPLGEIVTRAGAISQDTGGPEKQPEPTGPVVPLPGVLQNPTPHDAGLLTPGVLATPTVTKEVTAGITEKTGAYGNPLIGGEDDIYPALPEGGTADGDEEAPNQVALKAEADQFVRFVKARRRAGKWRPFVFKHFDEATAGRMNAHAERVVKAGGDAPFALTAPTTSQGTPTT